VAIKYQVNFPGADPMNAQTQAEVAPRQTYYGVNGVPYAPINGDTLPLTDWAGTGYTGGPYHYTQEIIDSAYASPAPFSLNVSHTISTDLDSIFITATVTAAQALTGLANPKLRLAIIEKVINFDAAPGSNGETEFFDVMRRMVPNATGTTLGGTWTNAQTQSFTFGVAMPTFIYDLLQIRVVGFIQTDGNKVVHQAAISQPIALVNYADGEKRYIIAPNGLQVGATVLSGDNIAPELGNALQLKNMPLGTMVHNIEMQPGQGGKLVRSAGGSAQLANKEEKYGILKMPSGELRKVLINCYACGMIIFEIFVYL
jgi:hypothetical protein